MDDGYVYPMAIGVDGLQGVGRWTRLAFFRARPILNYAQGGDSVAAHQ